MSAVTPVLRTPWPTGSPGGLGAVFLDSADAEVTISVASGVGSFGLIKYGPGSVWWPVTEAGIFEADSNLNGGGARFRVTLAHAAYYHLVQLGNVPAASANLSTIAALVAAAVPIGSGLSALALASALVPVYVAADGIRPTTTVENTVAAMAGLLKSTAGGAGVSVDYYLPGQIVPGFSGLTVAQEVVAYNGALTDYGSVPSAGWYRSVGFPTAADRLNFILGPVYRKP